MAAIFMRRWKKEIKDAEASKTFKAYYDKTGIINKEEPGKLYIVHQPHSESPYGNQIHVWSVKFKYGREPNVYTFPAQPPLVRCETPIWHPNISKEGSICLDLLKEIDPASQAGKKESERENGWQPTYGIEAIFNSIQALLEEPNTASPFNTDANVLYIKHRDAMKEYKKAGKEVSGETARYRAQLDEHYQKKLLDSHRKLIQLVREGKFWGDEAL